MIDNTVTHLRQILANVRKSIPTDEFCGLGIVIYTDLDDLPVWPLCPHQEIDSGKGLVELLAHASLYSNPCHDGFHLVSDRLELTHINQYFAPPLPVDKEVLEAGRSNRGARYMSAQIGSLIKSIRCTGIFSDRDGLVIFQAGKEIR